MAFTKDNNVSSIFTIISSEGMNFVDKFDHPPQGIESSDIQIDNNPPSLTTNADTPPLKPAEQNKDRKWMKIESCVNNCHLKISALDQKHTFDTYWQNSSVPSRYKFINDRTKLTSLKESDKKCSMILIGDKKYYSIFTLNTTDGHRNVCRACFRFILSEQEPFITAVVTQKMVKVYDLNKEDEVIADNSATNKDSTNTDLKNYTLPENSNRLPPCHNKCNTLISVKDQKQNFHDYWYESTIEQRCQFISDMTELRENQRYKNNPQYFHKPYLNAFYLNTKQGRQNVCASCFPIILKEANSIITEVLDEKWRKMSSELENGDNFNQVMSHINKFPLNESHHVTDSGTEKYLPRGLTLETMYNLYKDEVRNPVSYLAYQRIFARTKLRFLSSIVGKCLQCETVAQQTESSNLFKDKMRLESFITSHLNGAVKSHSFKSRDERRKCQSLMVCSFKFHQSLPTPFLDKPIYYYKQPLWTYNFTVREILKKKSSFSLSKSYVWDETQGRKSVNEIASCLYQFFEELPPNIKTVILYSSSCNGESRSKLLCMILSNLVMNHKSLNLLEHKFLLDGHFYLDKNKKNDWCQDVFKEEIGKIEEPQDWYNALSKTSKNGKSEVIIMENDMFFDFKGLLGGFFEGWLDGGMIDDDVTCVQYNKNGVVYYKKKWSGNYELMYSNSNLEPEYIHFSPEDLSNLDRIPLTVEKKKGLLDLLPFLSPKVHKFYESLPVQKDPIVNDSELNLDPNDKDQKGGKISVLTSEKLYKTTMQQCDLNLNKEKAEPTSENSEEDDRENLTDFVPEVCVVKEELDLDNIKESFNRFSEDESEVEVELNQTDDFADLAESEQTVDENSIIETPIFSNNENFQVESFNKKFYDNDNSVDIMEIVNNLEKTSSQGRILYNQNVGKDYSSGLNFLKQMKKFQPLSHCSNLCYLKVTAKDQERIFSLYWHKGTADSRFKFLYETIKLGPKSPKSEKFLEDNVEFSVKFCLETDHGMQNVCKFCFTKILCERQIDIITVLKLKSQALIEGIKAEVSNIENEPEQSSECDLKLGRLRNEDISKWKTAEYDCPSSKLFRNEKLQKGWTRLQPCRNGCFLTIKSEDQDQIFNTYWEGATIHSRYYFINASIKKNKSHLSTEKRSCVWRKYYHNTSKGPQRACKRCFCLVLGETVKFVESVLKKTGITVITKKLPTVSKSKSDEQPGISNTLDLENKNISVSKPAENVAVSSSKSVDNEDNEIRKESNQQSFNVPDENYDKTCKENVQKITVPANKPKDNKRFDNIRKIQQIQIVEEHIKKFLISEICENNSKLRISIQMMYVHYKKEVSDPLCIGWYQNILAVSNVDFKPAFIDKCKECELNAKQFKTTKHLPAKEKICECLTSHLNYSKILYKYKFQEEESARLINSLMVCSFGFQQNFLIPSQNNSSRHRLSIFNLTIWQRTNNHVLNNPMYYVWPQVEGKRTANEIASCLFQYLKQLPTQVKSLIIYSSSCHGESRSKTLAMMFSYLITNHKSLVSVDHKFTYSGHSQLKEYLDNRWVDNIMKDNFIKAEEPQDWYNNFQTATKDMNKSNFVFMEPDMFYDFESLWKDPSVEDDPCIGSQVMWLKYTKKGSIFFKKSLLERHNFEVLSLNGQHQTKDLLNLQLCNLDVRFEVNEEAEDQLNSPLILPMDQCIIKTEVDFEDNYQEYEDQPDDLDQGPSHKRRKTTNEPIQEVESLRSKRIRKKRKILSL